MLRFIGVMLATFAFFASAWFVVVVYCAVTGLAS